MVLNTATVGAAVTPTVIETWVAHYLNRKKRKGKPTAHISYDAGLHLIRQFLIYASHHTVEEIQTFTAQWIPSPSWVKLEEVPIPETHITNAAAHINKQLGPLGIENVGGKHWWQWRRDQAPLKAEWVEMRKDADLRKKRGGPCQRSMLYVHGGAYYFGSADEHRYQIQRHARKLQARVLVPKYRLAPQFPFPCGLLDCLAAYLFMLETQKPETIILGGDSAGGGMALALLVVLRDQGIPLPAGAVLISPWCDLTHSFPSVAQESEFDYIPPCGFHHRPSMAWPPPNSDDLKALGQLRERHGKDKKISLKQLKAEIAALTGKDGDDADGYTVKAAASEAIQDGTPLKNVRPGPNGNYSIVIDNEVVELKDQIQMYAPNGLLVHPLVSPVLQPSLGGLPPMLVSVGGGEMLRDEQIYLAHKAANPAAYPAPETPFVDKATIDAETAAHPPTKVQLQVWDDLCHVGPTLSFTRPAKYQFRSIAQFGAWALASAQKREIRILDDDEISDMGSDSGDEEGRPLDLSNGQIPAGMSVRDARQKIYEDAVKAAETGNGNDNGPKPEGDAPGSSKGPRRTASTISLGVAIGKAGDPLPTFYKNMIRQRVTRHGDIYPLGSAKTLPACNMAVDKVGAIKSGPVRKWLAAQDDMNRRFAGPKRKVQLQRLKQMFNNRDKDAVFLEKFPDGRGDVPPPTAMAGLKRSELPKAARQKESRGLAMWVGLGSKHDSDVLEKQEEKIQKNEEVTMSVAKASPKSEGEGQPAGHKEDIDAQLAESAQAAAPAGTEARDMGVAATAPPPLTTVTSSTRVQTTDGSTVPFKVRPPLAERNPSTMTLSDESGTVPPPSSKGARSIDSTAKIAAAATPAAAPNGTTAAKEAAGDADLKRQKSTKGWALGVLSRAGFGTVRKPHGRTLSEEEAAPAPPEAASSNGAAAPLAVQEGEVVKTDERPEPTRFVTAPLASLDATVQKSV